MPAPFSHDIIVTWGDCDPARIAYTGRIPAWALEAINAFWQAHLGGGWYHMELDRNLGTPFVHLSMDFKSPITPRHTLRCAVRPSRLGTTSITFDVSGAQNGITCFTGTFVSVFTIADQFKRCPPPQEIRDILAPWLEPV